LFGDVIDSTLYVDQSESLPQAGGKPYRNVSTVDRMNESLPVIFTRTLGGLHIRVLWVRLLLDSTRPVTILAKWKSRTCGVGMKGTTPEGAAQVRVTDAQARSTPPTFPDSEPILC